MFSETCAWICLFQMKTCIICVKHFDFDSGKIVYTFLQRLKKNESYDEKIDTRSHIS